MSAHLTRVVVRQLADGEILVEPLDHGCGRCQEPGGCGGAMTSCSKPRLFQAQDTMGVKVGEVVEVAIGAGRLARAVTYTYLFPLVGLVLGALLTSALAPPYQFLAAVSGLLIGYLAGRREVRREKLALPSVVKRCGMNLEDEK